MRPNIKSTTQVGNVGVIGAGAWGLAVAMHLQRGGHSVAVFNRSHVAPEKLPLGATFTVSTNPAVLSKCQTIFIVTAFAGLAHGLHLAQSMGATQAIWLCKGVDAQTGLFGHEIAKPYEKKLKLGVLSGPSFAAEVALGLPVALTIASTHAVLQQKVLSLMHRDAMRIYTSTDVMGVEVGGAVKNVIAVACGVSDGMQLGMNARAALIARGLNEMVRFGRALGAHSETLAGLTGAGDLVLTCTGGLSRNRAYGEFLAQGLKPEVIENKLGHVAEGARCVHAIVARAKALGVDMPICNAVSALLMGKITAPDVVQQLLARDSKSE